MATGYRLSAIGYRLLAIGSWLSALGYRLLVIGSWLSALGYRFSVVDDGQPSTAAAEAYHSCAMRHALLAAGQRGGAPGKVVR